ncbi:hypothetical protein Q5P01_024834 [Channa striata]|uniref:Uncharacterized protein n=1 Tax=Channa striata TaxID=64152 RepID=A0AA88IR90_CHASR|nr:hypothetical protein Q5P01_024834 [Channa striata]
MAEESEEPEKDIAEKQEDCGVAYSSMAASQSASSIQIQFVNEMYRSGLTALSDNVGARPCGSEKQEACEGQGCEQIAELLWPVHTAMHTPSHHRETNYGAMQSDGD